MKAPNFDIAVANSHHCLAETLLTLMAMDTATKKASHARLENQANPLFIKRLGKDSLMIGLAQEFAHDSGDEGLYFHGVGADQLMP